MFATLSENVQRAFSGIPMAYFGLALNKAWVFLAMPYLSLQEEARGFTAFDLMFAIAALCIAVISLKIAPARLKQVMTPVSTIATIAASLLLLIAYAQPMVNTALVIAAMIAAAIGVMSMAALWADFYALFNPLRATFLNAGAIIGAILLSSALRANEPPRIFLILTALALLIALTYKISIARSVSEQTRNDQKCCKAVFPYKAVLFIAAYSFAYGMAMPLQSSVAGLTALRILPALVIVAFAFLDAKRFSMRVLYNIAFPFMVCGLLVVALIPGIPAPASAFLLDTSYSAMGLMLIIIACSISYSLGASAAWLFGMMVAVQFFTKAAGQMASELISSYVSVSMMDSIISIGSIALIIVASIAMLSEKSIFSNWGAQELSDSAGKEHVDPLKLRVRSLGEAYRLTTREMEVLHLLALGKPNAGIARDLFIAQGTVKAHIQHIYQKLDVHTRKELLDLMGTEKRG